MRATTPLTARFGTTPRVNRTLGELARFFDGLGPVEPCVVQVPF